MKELNLHPHQHYTAKFDPIKKIYNIYCWTHQELKLDFEDSKPVINNYHIAKLIDSAVSESEVWKKLLHYRTTLEKSLYLKD